MIRTPLATTPARPAVPWALAGLCLLLLRPMLVAAPGAVWSLAAVYAALGTGSFLSARPVRGLDTAWPWALGVGLAAVGVVAVAIPAAARPSATTVGVGLTLLASVAEEAFFRGFLYARLARRGPVVAIVGSALMFALVHVPAYGVAALWVDLGAGLLLSWQRWASGTWLVPAATHVAANLLVVMG